MLLIRRHQEGEEPALFEVYCSAIHLIASRDYTPEQIQAWAPRNLDPALWERKIRDINPFVVELKGQITWVTQISNQTAISTTSLCPGVTLGKALDRC